MAYQDMGFNNPYNTLGGYMQEPNQYFQAPQTQQMSGGGNSGGGKAGGIGSLIGGGIQSVVGIVDWIKGAKEYKKYKKETESALAGLPEYEKSIYAQQNLANAQNNANAIDPSILMQYNQLQKQAANTAAVGQRNAMSGAEAIQAAALGQNIAANQAPEIARQQAQMNMMNRQALSNALANMTQEQQNEFNSKNYIANQMLNYKMGLMGAAANRKASGINNTTSGLSAVGSGVATMGML